MSNMTGEASSEKKLTRSDVIALAAAVFAGASAFFSWLAYDAQYSRKLIVQHVSSEDHFVFPYAIRREKTSPPYVAEIGSWYLLRISNISSRAISIVDFLYRVDDAPWKSVDKPLVAGLNISEQSLAYKQLIELPLLLDAGISKEISLFLPTPVKELQG